MAKCSDICAVYKAAAGADDTHRTVFIDEMSGIQALERIAPGLPMVPGRVERWRVFSFLSTSCGERTPTMAISAFPSTGRSCGKP
jgi:hypothetical protein